MSAFLNCLKSCMTYGGPGMPVPALRCHTCSQGLGRDGTSREAALSWCQRQILDPVLLPLL